jgi:hypothetical protein
MGLQHNWNPRLIWTLILTDDAAKQARLEKRLESTRDNAVTQMLEEADWSHAPEVLAFRGGRGTPEARLAALREAWRRQWGTKYADDETPAEVKLREAIEAIEKARMTGTQFRVRRRK